MTNGFKLVGQLICLGIKITSRITANTAKGVFNRVRIATGSVQNKPKSATQLSPGRMHLDEAYKILNVPKEATEQEAYSAFQRLFHQNTPSKGGSFYLQSKIARAMEAIQSSKQA